MTEGFSDSVAELSSSEYPLAQGSVYGFRWCVPGMTGYVMHPNFAALHGVTRGTWYKGTNEAACEVLNYSHKHICTCLSCENVASEHASGIPAQECACGFYAYWSYHAPFSITSSFAGVIEGSGRTIIGTKGFRTQYAQIKALYRPFALAALYDEDLLDSANNLYAEAYEVPVYTRLEEMLADFPLTTDYLSADPIEARSDSTETRRDTSE